MPFLITNFKKVLGLSGSGPARLENQENSGSFLAIGGQLPFGALSRVAAAAGALAGGFAGGCDGEENTGMAVGGNGGFSNSMAYPDVNSCFPITGHPLADKDDPHSPTPTPCPFLQSGPGSYGKGS